MQIVCILPIEKKKKICRKPEFFCGNTNGKVRQSSWQNFPSKCPVRRGFRAGIISRAAVQICRCHHPAGRVGAITERVNKKPPG